MPILPVLLLACQPDTEPHDDTPTEPTILDAPVDGPGTFPVGYRSWELTYTPGPGIPERTIVVALWYPAATDVGATAEDTMGIPLRGVLADVPAASPTWQGGYPVIAHSHGYQGWSGNSAHLLRHLASHGWLVLVPDHTDNTLAESLDPLPARHYFERPLDIRLALDSLEQDPELGALAQTDRTLLSGHSFGTYTTWAGGGASYDPASVATICAAGPRGLPCTPDELAMFATDLSDHRVVATMPLAGSYREEWFGPVGYRTVNGPVFAMSGTNDEVGDQAQWDMMTDLDLTWVEVIGGCHQTFGLGLCSTLPDDVGFPLVDTFTLAFARASILGDTSTRTTGILDGSEPVDGVIVHTR